MKPQNGRTCEVCSLYVSKDIKLYNVHLQSQRCRVWKKKLYSTRKRNPHFVGYSKLLPPENDKNIWIRYNDIQNKEIYNAVKTFQTNQSKQIK